MSVRDNILSVLFDFPLKSFSLRELSRKAKVSIRSVILCINKLENETVVKVEKHPNINLVSSNNNEKFRELKLKYNLESLKKSGLIEKLSELTPDVIILFGSYSRGEDTPKSDIDIALIGTLSKNDTNLTSFEKKLKRKISIHKINNLKTEENEFKNTLANGKILKGYLNLF